MRRRFQLETGTSPQLFPFPLCLLCQFDWPRYFGAIIKPNFNDTEVVGTYDLTYLKRVGAALQDTPTR